MNGWRKWFRNCNDDRNAHKPRVRPRKAMSHHANTRRRRRGRRRLHNLHLASLPSSRGNSQALKQLLKHLSPPEFPATNPATSRPAAFRHLPIAPRLLRFSIIQADRNLRPLNKPHRHLLRMPVRILMLRPEEVQSSQAVDVLQKLLAETTHAVEEVEEIADEAAAGTIVDQRPMGNSATAINVSIKPAIDMNESSTVQLLSVSFSVKPLILQTTQKPLSFIQEQMIEPKPTARKM